jgi:hypothetical protein
LVSFKILSSTAWRYYVASANKQKGPEVGYETFFWLLLSFRLVVAIDVVGEVLKGS